jgi:hypothetical protein
MSEEKQVESSEADESQEAPSTGSGQAKMYTEEQFKGLLADKQAEVKKRQELERQLAQIKENESKAKKNPTSGTNEGQVAEDQKPMTVGLFKKLTAEQRTAELEADFELRQKQCTETALAEYTAEKYGEGLDFESVIAAGEKNLTDGDLIAIKKAKDPAAEKYRRCIMLTSELTERQQALSNAKLLEEIKLTGRVPATGATVPNASAKDVSQMSDEELDKLAETL